MQNTDDKNIFILASASPRRNDLLQQAGLSFSVIPSGFDEGAVEADLDPDSYVRFLAEAKADDIADKYPDSWVLGADTIVLLDGEILEKPASAEHAGEMLSRLSGKVHRVLTGYALIHKSGKSRFVDAVTTEVTFKELSEAEIDWYVETGEPFGKAGSYAIQGIGSFIVTRINGSYTNVVGLPVCEVIEALKLRGVVALDTRGGGYLEKKGN